MKKLLVIMGLLLFMTGCTDSDFAKAYNKMQVSSKGINGYTLDLRIYGLNGTKRVNEIARVVNYMNKNYSITTVKPVDRSDQETPRESVAYIIGSKKYTTNVEGKYAETTEEIMYSNPSVYLDGLKTATKVGKSTIEKIGTKSYTVYNIKLSKAETSKLLKDTVISTMKVTADATGKIYIDADGYVYRMIYTIGTITINANYFGINTARDVTLPN